MVKEIISRPLLRNVYLDNRNRDKVVYLEVPKKICRQMLVNEVEGSGKHFAPVLAYIDKDNRSKMVFISAATQEQGMMAVSYIAGSLGESCRYTDEPESDSDQSVDFAAKEYYANEEAMFSEMLAEEGWTEEVGKIPVITASDVACYYSNGYTGIDFGMELTNGQSERRDKVPYWTKCHKEAVCILLDDFMGKAEIDILNRFSTNKRVYVVFSPKKMDDTIEPEVMEFPFGNSISEINAMKNKAILFHGMDEIQVCLPEEYKWKYYLDVTKQALRDHNIVNASIIPYNRIIAVAESVSPYGMCRMINKLVEYAMKDYPSGSVRRFKKADFDFLDRFENRKTLGTKKAADRLDKDIIGLEDVKKQVNQVVNVMKFHKQRSEMGMQGEKYHNVHVMLGAPGTAKTTVAKLMGEIMTEECLLPGTRTIVVNGAQLKGEYVGQSAPKTHALFERHDIIIIDEAYSMVDRAGGTDSFSNEAIAQLIIELEKHATDKLVIFAGYGGRDVCGENNRMQLFLDANPGIQSRIASTFYFPSYSPEDMLRVFLGIAKRNQYIVEKEAYDSVRRYFASRTSAKDFGNGREARNLLDACTLHMADRLMKKDKSQVLRDDMMLITESDVRMAVESLRESIQTRYVKRPDQIGFR